MIRSLIEQQQLYHSIHAKGENVEDVLREAEAAEKAPAGQDEQPLDESPDHMDADVDVPVVDTAVNTTAPAQTQQVPQLATSQVCYSLP